MPFFNLCEKTGLRLCITAAHSKDETSKERLENFVFGPNSLTEGLLSVDTPVD